MCLSQSKQIAPTPRHRHKGSRDLLRGCEGISFSVSTTAKAYNLMRDVGRATASIYRQTSRNTTSLVVAASGKLAEFDFE